MITYRLASILTELYSRDKVHGSGGWESESFEICKQVSCSSLYFQTGEHVRVSRTSAS